MIADRDELDNMASNNRTNAWFNWHKDYPSNRADGSDNIDDTLRDCFALVWRVFVDKNWKVRDDVSIPIRFLSGLDIPEGPTRHAIGKKRKRPTSTRKLRSSSSSKEESKSVNVSEVSDDSDDDPYIRWMGTFRGHSQLWHEAQLFLHNLWW